jgi:hypothetical protein
VKTFVLTWNGSEEGYSDQEFQADQARTQSGQAVQARWSFGSRRTGAAAGDKVYLLRQVSARGIVASGTLQSGDVDEGTGTTRTVRQAKWRSPGIEWSN